MSDSEDIPKSIANSTINLFGVELKCHVLDNGKRVIEAESMEKLFDYMANGNPEITEENTEEQATSFAKWLRGGSK